MKSFFFKFKIGQYKLTLQVNCCEMQTDYRSRKKGKRKKERKKERKRERERERERK